MKATLILLYGIGCYLLFLATYAVFALFVAGLVLPRTIDSPAENSFWPSLVLDCGLIALFGLQHSVMARPAFKEKWTKLVPHAIERSTYLVFSCVALGVLMWRWEPINLVVWDVQNDIARLAIWGLFVAGWLGVPLVSLLINHFDLFGLRQVWLRYRGRKYTSLPFRTPLVYARVRHPLYLSWALAFWAIPTMTVGHLIFSLGMTAYMVAAAFVEERDLVAHFGEKYRAYQKQVPMFVPALGKANKPVTDVLDGTPSEA